MKMLLACLVVVAGVVVGAVQAPTPVPAAMKPFEEASIRPCDLDALPPVGQFPAGSLDADRLTQRFFPAGIEVELSFVPEDELAFGRRARTAARGSPANRGTP